MSRTYKDISRRKHFNTYWQQDHILLESFGWRLAKTTKPKLRKELDTEDHYLSGGPSWWNNLFHTRPIRRKFRDYCSILLGSSDLEVLEPLDSNKPHQYYY